MNQPRPIPEGPMMHSLKCESIFFDLIIQKLKLWECRKADREFRRHDILCLKEVSTMISPTNHKEQYVTFTGRALTARIVHVIHSHAFPEGIKEGYCMLQLADINDCSYDIFPRRGQEHLDTFTYSKTSSEAIATEIS